MADDFESCISNIGKLAERAEDSSPGGFRNEATTRLHLIDRLLFDCLGWDREDCTAEERFAGTYADYSLGRPARRLLVEAKKEGIYFELPAGFDKRVCRAKTILEDNKEIASAIEQAVHYCQSRGIPVAVVSNGHQLIALIASRQDGVPPLEGRALIFTSVADMRADFGTLWRNLSRPGILAHNIYKELSGDVGNPPPEKLSQRLVNYPGFKNRNPLQVELKILGELFIEDIAKDPEIEGDFLEQCYCPSGALSQYALISKQILQTRYSVLFQKEVAAPTLQPTREKTGLAREITGDILAASLSRRPIILLGDVGVGKSIFIRHFIRLDARDILDKSLVLYIDFGKGPALSGDLSTFVLDGCADQLLDVYGIDVEERNFVRGVYHFELERFSKSMYADLKEVNPSAYTEKELEFLDAKLRDRESHLRSCLEHLTKAQKRQVVIFLDNIDQRPFEFQELVFLIGESIAATWPGTVFVSLRPDTFFRSRNKGSLTAYQPRVFTVAPPRVDLVVSKRLRFALGQLSNTGQLAHFPGLSLKSQNLTDYVTVLLQSFETNGDLMEFVDNLSGGNIRQALDFLNSFVGSGHVNSQEIMAIQEAGGRYIIAVHQFMRAVIYGDHEHYDPSASPIVNLFDLSLPDGREHFLLPIILAYVERLGAMAGEQGFVELDRIFDSCQSLAFGPSQVQFALGRAWAKRLLEPSSRFSDDAGIRSCRITTVGAYATKKLVRMFPYVDAMIVDTPIVDHKAKGHIQDAISIAARLDRADIFRTYLDAQWIPLRDKGAAFDWGPSSQSLRAEIAKIKSRI